MNNSYEELEIAFEDLHASYNALLKESTKQKEYNKILVSILEYHKIRVPQFEHPYDIDF